jgi:biopolymer transport protein ExbD
MSKRFSRFSAATPQETSTIDIAPLIDVVFILLIFFIVTTVFVDETGIDVDKPRAASQRDLEKNSILIGITPEGRVFHGGREVGTGSVRAIVRRLREADDTLPVIIQADRRTPTETTVEVLDEAKLAGADQVFVSTVGD